MAVKRHIEQKTLPYSPEQMFSLVTAVDKYSEFAPWCVASRIKEWQSEHVFFADLVVGYKVFRERFTSKVFLTPPEGDQPGEIYIEYLRGPLKQLKNKWKFSRAENGSCIIDFNVEFEFTNSMLQGIAQVFFQEIVK
ncbi:MAG: type II toxin-antitoxin system RatA family toxin, partial [Alphaproteobacteria bacterium]